MERFRKPTGVAYKGFESPGRETRARRRSHPHLHPPHLLANPKVFVAAEHTQTKTQPRRRNNAKFLTFVRSSRPWDQRGFFKDFPPPLEGLRTGKKGILGSAQRLLDVEKGFFDCQQALRTPQNCFFDCPQTLRRSQKDFLDPPKLCWVSKNGFLTVSNLCALPKIPFLTVRKPCEGRKKPFLTLRKLCWVSKIPFFVILRPNSGFCIKNPGGRALNSKGIP